ncbi:hypothetical protein BVX98_01120 [bacterium F11]|nr:hypothetical protein BVX98_01120 [bacterium F11]
MADLTHVQKLRRQKNLYSWTAALLLAGSILILNFVVGYLPIRMDTSEGKIYSISKGSKQLLKDLDDPLLIRLFFSSKLPPNLKLNEQYIHDLLSEYKRASKGKIRIEYLDPSQSDKIRQQAIQAGIAPVKLDVRERNRREVRDCFMGMSLLYGDQSAMIPFIQQTKGLEYEITLRIKKLVHPGEIKLGVLSNGESLTFEDAALKDLKTPMSELFTIVDVNLDEEIPSDIRSLWLVGPTAEISEEQAEKLASWVVLGGTLGLLIDRHIVDIKEFRATALKTGLEDLLAEWGVEFRSGLVVDPRSDTIQVQSTRGFIQWINRVEFPYFPLTSDLDRIHPATKDIDVLSFPFVSPLKIKGKKDLSYTILAKSSKYSWLDPFPSVMSPLQRHAKKESAEEGPFNLGLIIEGIFGGKIEGKEDEAPVGRVIVFGTSRFVRTDFPPRTQNFSLFMNLLDWSVQDEALLKIRSAGAVIRPLRPMSEGIRFLVKNMLIFFLPIFSILLGFVIWKRAKIRRSLLPLTYTGA